MDDPHHELFRREAIAARRAPLLGDALLPMSLPLWSVTAFALGSAAALGCLLAFGELPRRATARGWLAPDRGLVEVIAPQAASVLEVTAHEGAPVVAGAPLLRLAGVASTAGAPDLAAVDHQRHAALRQNLAARRRDAERVAAAALARLDQRATSLGIERDQLDAQRALAEQRAALGEARAEAARALATAGSLAKAQAAQLTETALEQRAAALELERRARSASRALAELSAERRAARAAAAERRSALDAEALRLDQEAVEDQARRAAVVRAPLAGTVTAVAVRRGETTVAGQRLLTLLPAGAVLEARLLVATRDAGLLEVGVPVLMRLEAFPHQRFGVLRGRVKEVARSAVLPREADAPVSLDGAAYPVRIELAAQEVAAYGRRWPLRAGLLLEADLVLERTALWQRLVEPLRVLGRGLAR